MTHTNKTAMAQQKEKIVGGIKSISKTNTDYSVIYSTGENGKLNILNSHVFKYFMSPNGEFPDYPEPHNPGDIAKINSKSVSDYDVEAFQKSTFEDEESCYSISTDDIKIKFNKLQGTMVVSDKRTGKVVLKEWEPLSYSDNKSIHTVVQRNDEYFFGGGMQNGRFTHKGEVIHINNTNSWTDGGVTSPCPFYWSTYGYGVLRNTWQPGIYDFGSESINVTKTIHKGEGFDAFFFVNPRPRNILCDYYELTGRPIFMPEYAFYEAHLNAFNRDYWVKVAPDTPGAILFEDGLYYKSYKPDQMEDKTGILESLNGEKSNYQFSARAMIDRYKRHDLPLAWFIPNDGYGSGYGQTDSLDGDIQNLREFANYARSNGVEVALWTESQLEPKDQNNPKKGERDLYKEVCKAGIVALKCDVAWIGSGYSFGLNAVEHATEIFVQAAKHNVRPMIIMVDGWAGTQRYSGIWSGDQTGGEWEYIRFHIPTYIGSGLSGQPVVGSDMDGIYGGKSKEVNIRDFQWKTFTPLQLNMDGWGNIPKTPFAFDEEATAINRAYLKLKSMLMPYNYTIGHESTYGLPMIRAMFLEFPLEKSAYTNDSKYQYMWGPSILVAPVYNPKGILDASLRNGIYLPDCNQVWIDFFTGEKYQGGKILNNIRVPLWKIPIFVKDGAILPMTNPNDNPYEINRDKRILTMYPNGPTSFELYEDDGMSTEYLEGNCAKTKIMINSPPSNKQGDLLININKTEGSYKGMVEIKSTILQILASKNVDCIKAAIDGENIQITKVDSDDDFAKNNNVYYYKKDYAVNKYFRELGKETWRQGCLLIKIQEVSVMSKDIVIKIKDYANNGKVFGGNCNINKKLNAPNDLTVVNESITSSTVLIWTPVEEAIFYEIERDETVFTNITGPAFSFEGFKYESMHTFRIRSVNNEGVSDWGRLLTAIEKKDPHKYTVKGVKATCNIPCQPGQSISKLVDGDLRTMWHTKWNLPNQADHESGKVIIVTFDLGAVYDLDKFEYYPREDKGNGTILKIKYKFSIDGMNWNSLSKEINWKRDDKVKKVLLNGAKVQYLELHILESVTGFGAGRQVLFYKTTSSNTSTVGRNLNIVNGVKVTCNIPCETGQEVCKLIDGDTETLCMWHTQWALQGQANPDTGSFIKLNFDLGDIYKIKKIEYYPRDDAGNGNFLQIQYRYSKDSEYWSTMSNIIQWTRDETVKVVELNGAEMRFVEFKVLKTVRGFGSGRQILFYKTD